MENKNKSLTDVQKQDVICSEMMRRLCHEAEGTICKEKASDFLSLVGSVCTNSGGPLQPEKRGRGELLAREWEEE